MAVAVVAAAAASRRARRSRADANASAGVTGERCDPSRDDGQGGIVRDRIVTDPIQPGRDVVKATGAVVTEGVLRCKIGRTGSVAASDCVFDRGVDRAGPLHHTEARSCRTGT